MCTDLRHWSLTQSSRAFLAERRKRAWSGELRPRGTGLPPGTGLLQVELGRESRLARDSRDDCLEPNDSVLASSSI